MEELWGTSTATEGVGVSVRFKGSGKMKGHQGDYNVNLPTGNRFIETVEFTILLDVVLHTKIHCTFVPKIKDFRRIHEGFSRAPTAALG